MAYSARLLATSQLQILVNQVAHGFAIGDVLRFTGLTYVKAQADSEAHAAVCGMVSSLSGADAFYLCQVGRLNNIAVAKVAGTLYYLDAASAGDLTAVKPNTIGHVVVPCFIATGINEGYFFGNTGVIVAPSGTLPFVPAAINTIMSVNTGYLCSSGGTLNMTLPAVSAVGDKIQIMGISGFFKIIQAAGQSVQLGITVSTVGVVGTTTSTADGDGISLICTVANLTWQADVGAVGAFNII